MRRRHNTQLQVERTGRQRTAISTAFNGPPFTKTLGVTMLLLPPDNIDPKNKAMVDGLVDAEERKRSRRRWLTWLTVLGLSLAVLYAFNHGLISGMVGNVLAVAGIVGVFLFLVFLSTKPFGRGDTSIRWWWFC